MAINDVTRVVGVMPRISAARFAEILQAHGSPAASQSSAEEAWSLVQQFGVDPAFALAIFTRKASSRLITRA